MPSRISIEARDNPARAVFSIYPGYVNHEDYFVAQAEERSGNIDRATGSSCFEALVKLMMRAEAREGFDVRLEL